ncbi:hypothetical protein ACSNOH_01510 [Streptomyces sp. URMC 127]|uniref:hypothetical protein n=1 Tax=Streptomyces sp. URMC 127 TaxID=3423402 RepID=UPI003F1AC6A4
MTPPPPTTSQPPVCSLETSTAGILHIGPAHRIRESELRIVVSNPGRHALACDKIMLTMPVGKGADDVSDAPDQLRLSAEADAWALTSVGNGRFELVPTGPGAAGRLEPGARLVLPLTGVNPNSLPGAALLTTDVHWRTDTTTHLETAGFRMLKADRTDYISSFTASASGIDRGHTVTLTWKGRPKAGRPPYWLYIGTKLPQKVDQAPHMDADGNGRFGPLTLTETTAFMLLVETKDAGGALTYGKTLAVTVRNPDLVVGELSSNGTVMLMGKPTSLLNTLSGDKAFARTYTASTDGMIAACLERGDGSAPANLTAVVSAPGGSGGAGHTTRACARTLKSPENALVPVPKGATVELGVNAESGTYAAQLTWYPMGVGTLTPST